MKETRKLKTGTFHCSEYFEQRFFRSKTIPRVQLSASGEEDREDPRQGSATERSTGLFSRLLFSRSVETENNKLQQKLSWRKQ